MRFLSCDIILSCPQKQNKTRSETTSIVIITVQVGRKIIALHVFPRRCWGKIRWFDDDFNGKLLKQIFKQFFVQSRSFDVPTNEIRYANTGNESLTKDFFSINVEQSLGEESLLFGELSTILDASSRITSMKTLWPKSWMTKIMDNKFNYWSVSCGWQLIYMYVKCAVKCN